jgi:hypothetical protein
MKKQINKKKLVLDHTVIRTLDLTELKAAVGGRQPCSDRASGCATVTKL